MKVLVHVDGEGFFRFDYNGEKIVEIGNKILIPSNDITHTVEIFSKTERESFIERLKNREEEEISVDAFYYYKTSEKPFKVNDKGIGSMYYNGCGLCLLRDDCKEISEHKKVKVTFNKNEKWDDCGHFVTVFKKGETAELDAHVKDNNIYCLSGESTIYKGISDFVNIENVDVIEFVEE